MNKAYIFQILRKNFINKNYILVNLYYHKSTMHNYLIFNYTVYINYLYLKNIYLNKENTEVNYYKLCILSIPQLLNCNSYTNYLLNKTYFFHTLSIVKYYYSFHRLYSLINLLNTKGNNYKFN